LLFDGSGNAHGQRKISAPVMHSEKIQRQKSEKNTAAKMATLLNLCGNDY
jgi:hypothetical protein